MSTVEANAEPARMRRRLVVRGVVQGVGFRPHLAVLAESLGLTGCCRNDATSVAVEVEGPPVAIADFERRLVAEAPPLARIESVIGQDVPAVGTTSFVIEQSTAGAGERTMVPPDTAVCDACLAELGDPDDRRFRHPFITCTHCGPRLTITLDLPYDRPATTMAPFPLCADCAAEYADPRDRRYHAQPIACHACGPTLSFAEGSLIGTEGSLIGREGSVIGTEESLKQAVQALYDGRIVAIKGIGGYHLACDATNAEVVSRLRARKRRPHQPFAVMVADVDAARAIAEIDDAALALLIAPERPIVLLPERAGSMVAEDVAPGLGELGVMVAYAPVHHLILADLATLAGRPPTLVMTSGNASGEPLSFRDEDARRRLSGIADAFLTHDREIAVPVEDSVVAWSPDFDAVPIRRSRGHAPLPVDLSAPISDSSRPISDSSVLAAGAELKNTVALVRDGRAFVSAHVGDLESLASRDAHQRVTDQLLGFHQTRPALVVADQHPGYASRAWAQQAAASYGVPLLEVQHHHAHLAALAAEHRALDQPILGLVFDGTGYGCDQTIWGGEALLLGDHGRSAERFGRLATVRLPGGDAGVRHPVRTAAIALADAGLSMESATIRGALTPGESAFLKSSQASGAGLTDTSSVGRLFDIVAAVLGVRHRISYEAQAAVELEAAARTWRRTTTGPAPDLVLPVVSGDDGLAQLDWHPLLSDLTTAYDAGESPGALAWAFHQALAQGAAGLAAHAAQQHPEITTVGLTGGVFVNRILLAATAAKLREQGRQVLTHARVPANDGGLALGQAAVGFRHLTIHTNES